MKSGTKRALAIAAVFGGVWFSARYLLPLLLPFVLGLALAIAAEPVTGFLIRRFQLGRGFSCAISVTLVFFCLATLLLMAAAFLLRELKALSAVLPDLGQTLRSGAGMLRDWTLSLASHAPESVRPLMKQSISTLFSDGTSLLDRTLLFALNTAGGFLSHVPDSALTLGTGLIAAYLIAAKLPRIKRWLLRRISGPRLKALLEAAARMRGALGGWITAQAKLMGLTLLFLAAGFTLLRIPHPLLWAAGTALVDAFPVLGTGTVLLPWALLSLLQQNIPRSLGLLGLYVTVTLTRSMLEPKLLGRHLGLDPLATLMALYIGYRLWGIGGMILSPLLAVMALQLVPERK